MRRIACFMAALLWAVPAAAQQVELEMKVSPMTGSITDEFTVTVSQIIYGVNAPERYWPPDFGDFTVLEQRTVPSTQWLYDPRNGQQIRNVELRSYRLRANRAGRLRIGEARIRMDGTEYKTKPAIVEVLPAGKSVPVTPPPDPGTVPPAEAPPTSDVPGFTPPDGSTARPTFIHVAVDKQKAFLGEQVTVTWLLYTRSDVLKFEPRPPRFDGYWVETIFEPQSYFTYHPENVGGREYAVATISSRALFPTRSGKLAIPRFEADVSTLYTSFAAPLHLESPAGKLEVEPLPSGAPEGFDPAYVGSYRVEASVDRATVNAGESLTLTLMVSGAGAIRRTKTPALALDGFQVTPPSDFDQELDTSGTALQGTRHYRYVLTPTRGGKLTIPPVKIPTFDPAAKKYEIAASQPIEVTVVGDPAALSAKATGAVAGENLIGRDIRPPREVPSVTSRAAARFYHSRAFMVALAAPGALYLLVVLMDKLRERLRRETPRARLRRARGRARKRLRVAELHIRGNRPAKFFGEVARVLTEHLEERVGEPVTAMTRERLHDYLVERNFPEETVEALVRELESCDFARFAPSASGPGEMRAALRRVRALLGAIERVRPRAPAEVAA